MALFSEAALVAVGKSPKICPICRKNMNYNDELAYYKCPECQVELWLSEPENNKGTNSSNRWREVYTVEPKWDDHKFKSNSGRRSN